MSHAIDLNSDVGESFGRWTLGDDSAVMESVSSINAACGFHAGDPSVMLATCKTAVERGVTIGAHPAYRDLAGFGRRFLDASPAELTADVIYQIGALQAMASVAGGRVAYVKPHGALYNTIVHHEAQAAAVVSAIAAVDQSLTLLTLPGSVAGRLAEEAGLRVAHEAFADRAYMPDGSLVSRREPGAVLTEEQIPEHVTRIANGEIKAIDGTIIPVTAHSICVHGDSPGAVAMAADVKRTLEAEGITIRSFA
ncbi:5-oxoprolinase subunit PxpA [Falsarthrobacter nasiphocae]|uniref:5-oxoprolinase subunit A n=1 Tax=Falsarthrobacter nasiphocae TaxID=189863 RepID=A0AAE3YHI6_9MICC|nr:5-oxoprolinase subunit PxpA [Falsarthrobacter nasiphocae]MDR6892048.1 UPF0271 protein [Falsarthrobacter nasiphocae]